MPGLLHKWIDLRLWDRVSILPINLRAGSSRPQLCRSRWIRYGLYLMNSRKHYIVSTFSCLRGTSVIPSSISSFVKSRLFYTESSWLKPKDKHVSCLLSLSASISFLVVWGLTVDQLISSSSKCFEPCKYSTSYKNGPSLWRIFMRANLRSYDYFIRSLIRLSIRDPAILQSMIFNSSKWCGKRLLRSGPRLSIDFWFIPFIL